MSSNTDPDAQLTTVLPNILCLNCESFWARATCLNHSWEDLEAGGGRDGVPFMPQQLYHSTRTEIRTAASTSAAHQLESGCCHFCSILLGTLEGCTGSHEIQEDGDKKNNAVYVSITTLNREEQSFMLTLFPCPQSEIVSHDQIISRHTIRLVPNKDPNLHSLAVDEGTPSRAQTWTYSPATADLIKAWILECQRDHQLCGERYLALIHGVSPLPERPRPKRLLDLEAFDTADRIRLIEPPPDKDFPYCALSYSWGFSKPYILTSVNLDDFQSEILVANLPKSFRDTIEVVRGIGERYLWIDALCILQDGRTSEIASRDWYDQAGKMHAIFGGAIATITASEAHDGNQGFIAPRNPLSHTICQLENAALEQRFNIVPPCTPYCPVHPFDNAHYHLDTRGWCFQERLLSARTIHFTRNFVHFECRSSLRCEAMSDMSNCHHRGSHVKGQYENLFAVLPYLHFPGMESFVADGFLHTWHQLTIQYSTTNLSRGSDLLVALAGLTAPLTSREEYRLTWSFGMCREFLLREMLWYVRGGRGEPSRRRAPTWSWASIDVHGPGPRIMYNASAFTIPVASVEALPEKTAFTDKITLLEPDSKYAVKIKGPVKLGVPTSSPSSSTSSESREDVRVHPHCRGLQSIHAECPFHPDYDLPEDEDLQLYSLLVARGSDTNPALAIPGGAPETQARQDQWNTEMGLVLSPVAGHPGRYHRVGYFHHSMADKKDEPGHQPLPSLFGDDLCRVEEIEIV